MSASGGGGECFPSEWSNLKMKDRDSYDGMGFASRQTTRGVQGVDDGMGVSTDGRHPSLVGRPRTLQDT